MIKIIYERKKLYDEIWSEPVTKVAKRYGVSDVAIRKVCKSLNIPLPPRGYWAKLAAGHGVEKAPLPDIHGIPNTKVGKRSDAPTTGYLSVDRLDILTFPGQLNLARAISHVDNIHAREFSLNNKFICHKAMIEYWSRSKTRSGHIRRAPLLCHGISKESLDRVLLILQAIASVLPLLGGQVDDDMQIILFDMKIPYQITEIELRTPHTPTHEELAQIRKSEKSGELVKIRKWDTEFSGRLTFGICNKKYVRDYKNVRLEDQFEKILIQLVLAAIELKEKSIKRYRTIVLDIDGPST